MIFEKAQYNGHIEIQINMFQLNALALRQHCSSTLLGGSFIRKSYLFWKNPEVFSKCYQ